jgi:hypothetical protein
MKRPFGLEKSCSGMLTLGILLGCMPLVVAQPTNRPVASSPSQSASQVATRDDCRLIVTWDQQSMWCIQLAAAHRTKAVEPESVKQMLEAIVDEHAKVGVDRLVHCMFALCSGTVPPNLKSFYRQGWNGIYNEGDSGVVALEKAGYDLMKVLIDRSHHNGMEFMAGLRMNDRHGDPWQTLFGKEHPEWRMKELHGMDYRQQGVRDTVFAVAAELIERYDIDGLELDWMRHCHMFNANEAEASAHSSQNLCHVFVGCSTSIPPSADASCT